MRAANMSDPLSEASARGANDPRGGVGGGVGGVGVESSGGRSPSSDALHVPPRETNVGGGGQRHEVRNAKGSGSGRSGARTASESADSSKLIAIIADQDTVTGMLLAGVGE